MTRTFGGIIADLRREKGMTQERFAAMLGITPQAVSKWETGAGLPDVAMMPLIAQVLEVPVGRLFDESEPDGDMELAAQWEGMALCHRYGKWACYSHKAVESTEGERVRFADGSEADLKTGEVINRGPGEARIREVEWSRKEANTGEMRRAMLPGRALKVEVGGDVQLYVHAAETDERVEARGRRAFLEKLEIRQEGDMWILRSNCPGGGVGEDRLDVYMPGGAALEMECQGSCRADVEPDFAHTQLRVSGSSQFRMRGAAAEMRVQVSGAGEIQAERVGDLYLHVSGSGDSRFGMITGSVELHTSGASGFVCERGEMKEISIRCSGASTTRLMAGHADRLLMNSSGASMLEAENFSVDTADLQVAGKGEITLGEIREGSVERLSRECRLTVQKRGISEN